MSTKILDPRARIVTHAAAPPTPEGPLAQEVAPLVSLVLGVLMLVVIAAPSAL
jgi:hypothetical protein